FLRKAAAYPETVKLNAGNAAADRKRMAACGEAPAGSKGKPAGAPPVWPPQAALRKGLGASVHSHIQRVFIPKRKSKPYRYVIGASLLNRKMKGCCRALTENRHVIGHSGKPGVGIRCAAATVNVDCAEGGLLLLPVTGQIPPAVIDFLLQGRSYRGS